MEIRAAREDDAARLRDFLAALAEERGAFFLARERPPGLDEAAELIRNYAETPRAALLLAVSAQVVAGYAQFSAHSHPQQAHGAPGALAVLPAFRGQGLGRALLEALLERARRVPGLRRMSLDVLATNAPAIRLYERLGFAVDGRRREAVRVGEAYVDLLLMSRLV